MSTAGRRAAVLVPFPLPSSSFATHRYPDVGQTRWLLGILTLLVLPAWTGCSHRDADWPPPPRNQAEQAAIDSAARAVLQFDGWTEVAYVVTRRTGEWRVQAWKIVHPQARGRDRCVPWAKRGITVDDNARVVAYENHL